MPKDERCFASFLIEVVIHWLTLFRLRLRLRFKVKGSILRRRGKRSSKQALGSFERSVRFVKPFQP